MKLLVTYGLYCYMLFVSGCDTKDLFINRDFNNNNRSSKIDYPGMKMNLKRFLDYRVYDHKILDAYTEDSVIRSGIIFPKISEDHYYTSIQMQFGNGTDTCLVHCKRKLSYDHRGRSATLSIINLLSDKSKKYPQETKDYLISDSAAGVIKLPTVEVGINFSLQNIADPDNASGTLLINRDTFMLKPVPGVTRKNGETVKRLTGLQLVKGDIVYGVIGLSLLPPEPHRIFLYTKATSTEQMIIAAYFAVFLCYS